MSEQDATSGVVPLQVIRLVQNGWTTEAVTEHIGKPLRIVSSDEKKGPLAIAHELWAMCGWASRDFDEVWLYKHVYRGTFELSTPHVSFVCIHGGKVLQVWTSEYGGEI